jgi:hypothetical protein
MYLKTAAVARKLSVTYHRLMDLIRFDKLTPHPPRDSSNHFLWDEATIERARKLLAAGRKWREVVAAEGPTHAA